MEPAADDISRSHRQRLEKIDAAERSAAQPLGAFAPRVGRLRRAWSPRVGEIGERDSSGYRVWRDDVGRGSVAVVAG